MSLLSITLSYPLFLSRFFSFSVTPPLSSHLLPLRLIHPSIAFNPLPFQISFFPCYPCVSQRVSIGSAISACLLQAHKHCLCVRCCAYEYQIVLMFFPLHRQTAWDITQDLSVVPLGSALWRRLEHRGQYRRSGREREREGTETRLPHERQLLVCMMDVSGYNLIEHVYPCMCGRERRLSCLSVYCDVYCIQVQDCVCARLHLQQYFNVVYDGNKRLQLCNGGKGGRMFLPSGVCFFLRLRAFH